MLAWNLGCQGKELTRQMCLDVSATLKTHIQEHPGLVDHIENQRHVYVELSILFD